MNRIKADGDQSVAVVRSALADRLTDLDAAAAATTARAADLAAAQQAVRSRRVDAEGDVHARFAHDRAAVDSFFQDLLASLGTSEKIPTSVLDAAKKSLEARRSLELTAQDTSHRAESTALADQVRVAVAALDQESARLDADVQAQKSAVDSAADTAKRSLAADTAAALRQLDATAELKTRHAQEQLDLDAIQAAQTKAAMSWPKSQRDALAAKQKAEDDEAAPAARRRRRYGAGRDAQERGGRRHSRRRGDRVPAAVRPGRRRRV